MMYLWQRDMIRFMKDASEYNPYNQQLVDLLRPYITKQSRVCDVGCGLGYLSLALEPYVGQVTAVDINADVLHVLDENCRAKHIDNIHIQCGDISKCAPKTPYDCMVFCFFPKIHDILAIARQQCRGTVLAIKRNYRNHRFSVGTYVTGDDGYLSSGDTLTRLGIPFEQGVASIEFGQPFRSIQDARVFFELYSRDADKRDITETFLGEKLVNTCRSDFPFYLPHRREIGWLKWNVQDIPDDISV